MVRPVTRVVPLNDAIHDQAGGSGWQALCRRAGAWVYLLFTMACSVLYLHSIASSLANDHFWKDFNVTTSQTFLGDVFNSYLRVYTLSLSAPLRGLRVQKAYDSALSFMDTSPSYARQVMLPPLPLRDVILAMRNKSLGEAAMAFTQYCYVDMNRTFELAHTTKRQQRCLNQYKANAAVYLEPALRNAIDSINISVAGLAMQRTILQYLEQTAAGHEWHQYIVHHNRVPIEDEVFHWHAHGLTTFVSQCQNLYLQGIQDKVTIVNALGMEQRIQINQVDEVGRGLTQWTTAMAHIGFWNDLAMCQQIGCSLVRQADNFYETWGIVYDYDIMMGYTTTPTKDMVRQHIGPFGSIDLFLVPLPPPLATYFEAFQRELHQYLLAADGFVYDLELHSVDPVPARWRLSDALYAGGNPMCPLNEPQPFIQDSFGFYDACQAQKPFTVDLHSNSILFALSVMPHLSATAACNLCGSAAVGRCLAAIQSTVNTFGAAFRAPPLPDEVPESVLALNIQFVQVAVQNMTQPLWLTQPLVDVKGADPWSVFGWVSIYDWLQGQRELYSFQGDEGSVTLISPRQSFVPLVANALELPRQACEYMWYLSLYYTTLLVVVGMSALLSKAIHPTKAHATLFQFNRVVGSVWLGRPMVLLRGLTALFVLSTASLELRTHNTLTGFDQARRSVVDVALFAGEATWISYVLNDIALPFMSGHSHVIAPVNAVVAWVAIFLLELVAPVQAIVTIDRQCAIQSISYSIACASGRVDVGSSTRLAALVIIQVVAFAVVNGIGVFWLRKAASPSDRVGSTTPNLILPAMALALLTNSASEPHQWQLDSDACVMGGMIPLGPYVFDVKLWLLYMPHRVSHGTYTFLDTNFQSSRLKSFQPSAAVSSQSSPLTKTTIHRMRYRGTLGLAYVVLSVMGSYSYLVLSKNAFSNDFLWASFNSASPFSYLSNWYNLNLHTIRASDEAVQRVQLSSPVYGDNFSPYGKSYTTLTTPPLYASAIQHEVSSDLATVIAGLRGMDGCQLPWIFSAYCYVDFERRWEMAATTARQARCQHAVPDGAVYLEAIFRNANWAQLRRCWGQSIQIGLFAFLAASKQGQEWVAVVQSNPNSIQDEVALWQAHNIVRFKPQWQNFKTIGVIETYSIQNAVGIAYPLTIKNSNGTFQMAVETSMKMYWGLMSDLWAVAANSSGVGGTSLIRQSANFAYSNRSLNSIYLQNTSALVAGSGFALFQAAIGPFGTVDLQRVPVPKALLVAYQAAIQLFRRLLATDVAAQKQLDAMPLKRSFWPSPLAWRGLVSIAGNILCDVPSNRDEGSLMLYAMFTVEGSCSIGASDAVLYHLIGSMMAWAMLGEPSSRNISAICQREGGGPAPCWQSINSTAWFVQKYVQPTDMARVQALAQAAQAELPPIHLSQYMRARRGPLQLSFASVLNASDPAFHFFGWLYLINWVEGTREVVEFTGDNSHAPVRLLSGYTPNLSSQVNPMEIPVNASFYVRSLIQYLTFVLLCVACLVCLLIVTNRGYVEGYNMLLFNRVAGLVWVGRPLVLLRGLAAIALLSTSTLDLTRNGRSFFFAEVTPFWLTTIMSAGELTWLVYILNDTFSMFTKAYTAKYSSKSSMLAWAISTVWTFAQPATHVATLHRTCTLPAVDFQVVCQAGVVYIGNYSRFVSLIAAASAVTLFCYVLERWWHPAEKGGAPDVHENPTLFLYSAADHQFWKADWIHDNIYYLDKASAAMAGILAVERGRRIYLLDIKMWRTYVVDVSQRRKSQAQADMHPSSLHAIPLLE